MKNKTAKKKLSLATYEGLPTQAEIAAVIKAHREIVAACRSIWPRVFFIGQFFIDCHRRVPLGDRKDWLTTNFPMISYRNLALYGRLTNHRPFLEAKYRLTEEVRGSARIGVDFERVVSIKEAEAAIRDLKRSEKRSKAIDVESTSSSAEHSNGSKPVERATRIVPPPETLSNLLDAGQTVEHPEKPLNPKAEITMALDITASHIRAAHNFWNAALTVAEEHDIPIDKVRQELNEHFGDEPELALCFTSHR